MTRTGRIAAYGGALFACVIAIGCDGTGSAEDAAPPRDVDAGSMPVHRAPDGGTPRAIDAGAATSACDSPGAIESVTCGRCGTATRFCTSDGRWEVGPCSDEGGACAPGETRDGPCGRCGTQREVCDETCAWTSIGECAGESGCEPGTLTRTSEGCDAGMRDVRCTEACEHEAVSECTVDTCSTAGATESVPCGRCGTRQRFCTTALEWEYGPCSAEGVCDPGASRADACGRCGTVDMRCTDACEWFAFGTCSDEGECTPGSTSASAEGCASGETRPLLCSDSCEYEPSGACAPGPLEGEGGETCSTGGAPCREGLSCVESWWLSPICRTTCVGHEGCPAGTACYGDFCSDSCDPFEGTGCPDGSTCAAYLEDGRRYDFCRPVGAMPIGGSCFDDVECAAGLDRKSVV